MGFAGGQLEWQPALAVSNDCACALVQQQPHSSLHPPLRSKVHGGLSLHLKGPYMLSWRWLVLSSILVFNKLHSSLHAPLSSIVQGGRSLHLKDPKLQLVLICCKPSLLLCCPVVVAKHLNPSLSAALRSTAQHSTAQQVEALPQQQRARVSPLPTKKLCNTQYRCLTQHTLVVLIPTQWC